MAYLVGHGLAADKLQSQGFGITRPIDPAHNERAWEKNRRVEFRILKRAGT
jgi:outer membrane protein OmpA-like peptidoglycan-associated protein